MTREKGKHLSRENREVIEAGIRGGDPARAIAKRIDASPSTVDAAPTKPAPAKASSSPKTGDLSPLAIGGLALAALLGAGALAMSLARRRA